MRCYSDVDTSSTFRRRFGLQIQWIFNKSSTSILRRRSNIETATSIQRRHSDVDTSSTFRRRFGLQIQWIFNKSSTSILRRRSNIETATSIQRQHFNVVSFCKSNGFSTHRRRRSNIDPTYVCPLGFGYLHTNIHQDIISSRKKTGRKIILHIKRFLLQNVAEWCTVISQPVRLRTKTPI